MSPYARILGVITTVCVTAVGLVGCGASEPVTQSAASTSGEGKTTYPLTIDNCGVSQTFTAAPARVVSLDQGSTEILLSLGLEDRMVGTASWTDPVRENLAAANAKVRRLADEAPTYEVVMAANPTLVTASFGRHFRKEGGVAQRDRFAETSINTFLSPTDCGANGESINTGGKRSAPLTMDVLYQEITQLASIFDVKDRGDKLVADLKSRTEKATSQVRAKGTTVAFWFADTRTPYVAGGKGSANLIATTVGATNVFADLADDWPASTWPAVVDRNPQVLVVGDLARRRMPGDSLADKKSFLTGDPVTKVMPAVQGQRFVALHGAEMNPTIRMVDGIEKLSAGLNQVAP